MEIEFLYQDDLVFEKKYGYDRDGERNPTVVSSGEAMAGVGRK